MDKLSLYFNSRAFSADGPAPTAIVSAATTGVLLLSGSALAAGFAVVPALATAGYFNKWHETATGKPIWKPRTPFFGL